MAKEEWYDPFNWFTPDQERRNAARTERDLLTAAADENRANRPHDSYTDAELEAMPEYQDLLRKFYANEISRDQLETQTEDLRRHSRTIEYEQVRPDQIATLDPRYIQGQTSGYEAQFADPSAFLSLEGEDERAKYGETQQQSIDRLKQIGNEGGLTAIDRARIEQQRAGEEQWLRGQREATLAKMQERGLSGSGAEMASAFDQQQASANRNSAAGTQIEALAQQRQDQAWRDAFGQAHDARGQSFDEASAVAEGVDQTSRWNSQVGTDAAKFAAEVRNRGIEDDVNIFNSAEVANTGIFNDNTTRNNDIVNRGIGDTNNEAWNYYNAGVDPTNQVANAGANYVNTSYDVHNDAVQNTSSLVGNLATAGIKYATGGYGVPGASSGSTPRLNPIDVDKSGSVSLPQEDDEKRYLV